MKKVILIVVLLALLSPCKVSAAGLTSDYQFYFFGINSKFIKSANWGEIAIGAITSFATHWGAHYAYGKLSGMDVSYGVFSETMHNATNDQKANFARSGFIAQAVVGLALTSFEKSRNWDFTRGYVTMTAVETWTYPLRSRDGGGDLGCIDEAGGNGNAEWAVYSLIATHNLFRENFKK